LCREAKLPEEVLLHDLLPIQKKRNTPEQRRTNYLKTSHISSRIQVSAKLNLPSTASHESQARTETNSPTILILSYPRSCYLLREEEEHSGRRKERLQGMRRALEQRGERGGEKGRGRGATSEGIFPSLYAFRANILVLAC
jgi:hypothetical protein